MRAATVAPELLPFRVTTTEGSLAQNTRSEHRSRSPTGSHRLDTRNPIVGFGTCRRGDDTELLRRAPRLTKKLTCCPAHVKHRGALVDDCTSHELLRGHIAGRAGEPITVDGEGAWPVFVEIDQPHHVAVEVIQETAVVQVNGDEASSRDSEMSVEDCVQRSANVVIRQGTESSKTGTIGTVDRGVVQNDAV